jgi:hypothetical protein
MLSYTNALMEKPAYTVFGCVCDAGYMLSLLAAELLIQPLNYSVVFFKEKNNFNK